MRIATLNVMGIPDRFRERLAQVFAEAQGAGVELLALQELPPDEHAAIRDIARSYGFTAQHINPGRAGDGVGSFATTEFDATGTVTVAHPDGQRRFLWVASRGFLVINVHLSWGGHKEADRLREVAELDAFAAAHREALDLAVAGAPEPLAVLLGDFNAEPDNDSIRFLRGKTTIAGRGTYWTEATLGTPLQHVPTTRERDHWGRLTAASKGLDAELLYPRRIDYLFVSGWRHGNRGTAAGTESFGTSTTSSGVELSDHYGWVTELQD